MKPIRKEELCGRFCEYNDKNFTALSSEFELGRIKRVLAEYKNLYITSDSMLEISSLTSEELKKLNLQEIELIDGLWYSKSDLK
jgi:hypothetical protein